MLPSLLSSNPSSQWTYLQVELVEAGGQVLGHSSQVQVVVEEKHAEFGQVHKGVVLHCLYVAPRQLQLHQLGQVWERSLWDPDNLQHA